LKLNEEGQMIISGIDASINSSGITKFTLDDKLEIINKEFLAFTSVKKKLRKYDNGIVYFYHKNQFKEQYIEKHIWMEGKIIDFIKDSDFVSIEDYAMGSTKGQVFNIAEFTGCLKRKIFNIGVPLRKYDINSIKMFVTKKGNSDKSLLLAFYNKIKDEDKFLFPKDILEDAKSYANDIIDSYYIAKLLQLELKLRYGLVRLQDLELKEIEIFNRVTKGNPVNILARSFIEKKKLDNL
jgi:Holliday junction resolvasome RuvABC endonuclease subunit